MSVGAPASILTSVVIAAFSGFSASAQSTFHGDVTRSGVYAGPGPIALHGVKWTYKTGGPIVGSAAIADGAVYIASLDATLTALDEATGRELWKYKSRLPIASTPAVAGGLVYVVGNTGTLAALDQRTGAVKWVFAAEYEKKFSAPGLHGYAPSKQDIPDAWDMFTSSPAVANGKVFFGSGDGNVYALDAASGTLQWKFPTGNVVHASPAVANGIVYVGSFDSHLYALDAETGAQRWVFAAGTDPAIHNQEGFQSSPAVVDGVVYVGCRDAHVYALDAFTGKKKWDYPTSKSWVNATPAVRDGLVYAATADSSRIFALDAKTGRLRFNTDGKAYMFSSPVLAGTMMYIGNHDGRLRALDAKTGAIVWEFQTDAAKQDPRHALQPDGKLALEAFKPVFGDFQDMYAALSLFASVGAIMSSPAVSGGVVIFGAMDGTVYALM